VEPGLKLSVSKALVLQNFTYSFHKNLTLKSSTVIITMPLNFYQNGKLLLIFPSFVAAPQRIYSSSFWQYSEHVRQALSVPCALAPGAHVSSLPCTSHSFSLKGIPFSHLHPSFICHSIQLVRFLTGRFFFFFFNLSWLTLSLEVSALNAVLKLSSFSCPQSIVLGIAINTGAGFCF